METQATSLHLPGRPEADDVPYPAAFEVRTGSLADARKWLAAQAEELADLAAATGAVLLRGLPLETPEDFDAVVTAFGFPNFPYEDSLSNAYRLNYTPRIFSANEAPPEVTIFLHHEMAQTPVFPSKLFFCCLAAPEEGGATPVCRSDLLWERLLETRPRFASACLDKGLRYTNVMPAEADKASGMGRSWGSTFSSDTREAAEARMTELGYSWEWKPDGDLRATTPVLPATRDLGDGRRSFFNQLIAAFNGWKDARNDPRKAITFGDGSSLDPADVAAASELATAHTYDLPWRPGDLAIVDNFTAMHGRRPFRGKRTVLASLVA